MGFTVISAGIARAQPPGPTPVGVAAVEERDLPPSLRLVGTILADRSAVVAAEVAGVIASFEAEEGQFLKAGEVICQIDPAVSRLRVEEARAALAGLTSRLEELENGERPEELRRLEAVVAEAEALQEKWEFERRRVNDLFEHGQSSDKEKHDTEMEYLAATRRLHQAKAQLEMAVNGERPEVIAHARQAAAAQEAVVRRLERDLDKTQIRAPFHGAIVDQRTEVGEWIEEGGAVCEMIAMERVKVHVNVPERAIAFARPNQPATVEVEALGRTYAASITRVIPKAVTAARTFPVEIDLDNAEHTLLPGMFVWAYVPSGPTGKRLMVVRDAIVPQGTSKMIYVLRPGPEGGQMAIPTPVTTGLESEGDVAIEAPGVRAGDLVVIRGNERLFGPTPVMPMGDQPGGSVAADTSSPAAVERGAARE